MESGSVSVRIVLLPTHWVLVVMDQCTRRIVGFGVHRGVVDGVALCQMFNRAMGRQPAPTYAVLACARFRRQPAQPRVRAMTVEVPLEITELHVQIGGFHGEDA